ncbi:MULTISPECIES: cytochrome P450 family protein [unclassified Saccharothrix]|uniref:cytochrome P450 family protein n=1 Tax=unclassified Saccharothrix TaxID=2593673 RepID=UPI00307EE21A
MAAPVLSPQLFTPEYYRNPHPALEWLRKNSPVHEFAFPVDDVPTWIVTRYADVHTVLGDNRFSTSGMKWANDRARAAGMVFALGTVVEDIVTVLDPPDHTRIRKLAMGAFTPRRIEEWRATVDRIVDEALDDLAAQDEPDLMSFAGAVPAGAIGSLLGFRLDRFNDMLHAIDRAFTTDPELQDDRTRAFVEIGEYGRELIEERRKNPADDLTSSFIQARDGEDRLSEQELVSMLAVMIMAGLDTTRGVLGSASLGLMAHPDQVELLNARPDLLPNAVEEFIRYEGALATGLLRFAAEDLELGGVVIPKGSPVLASLLSANRDPEAFPDADRLDITRTGVRHVGLGHGLHNCLGAALARMEVGTGISKLFRRFPNMRLTVPREEVEWAPTWLIRSPLHLPVDLGAPAS